MHPKIDICGIIIPTYSICYCFGFMVSVSILSKMLVKKRLLNRYIKILTASLFGLLIGARLFGILSKLLSIYQSIQKWDLSSAMDSGIVYLGGLLGYLSIFHAICLSKKSTFFNSEYEVANVLAVVIPLFHFFGRLGCFFSGCCYGKTSSSIIAIRYPVIYNGAIEKRIPIQLIEAAGELILFIAITYKYKKECNGIQVPQPNLLIYYLKMYCVLRFVLEFYRGDEIRGVYFGVSFSQYVCVIVLAALFIRRHQQKRRIKSE